MFKAVLFASWKVRHGITSDSPVRYTALPDEVFIGKPHGVCIDLRRFGETNISSREVPLAVVEVYEDYVVPIAYVMRQDEEQVHFISIREQQCIAREHAGAVLHSIFARHHLPLNNFECNIFAISPEHPLTSTYLIESSGAPIASKLATALRKGTIPGFHLRPGHEFKWASSTLHYFMSLDGNQMVTIEPGGRGKDRTFDCIGWEMAVYRREAGDWILDFVREVKPDLQSFDEHAQTVAAQAFGSPLIQLRDTEFERVGLQAECALSGLILEFEIAIFGRNRNISDRSAFLTIRCCQARRPLDTAFALHRFTEAQRSILGFLNLSADNMFASEPAPLYFAQNAVEACALAVFGRIAIVGPSGSGKSTFADSLSAHLAQRGRPVERLKLAAPLYEIQRAFYRESGISISENSQDQILLEEIAKCMRRISPYSIVNNFESRLGYISQSFIINDDLRDYTTDYFRIKDLGFTVARVVTKEKNRVSRLEAREDISTVIHSKLDQEIAQTKADIIIPNDADLASFLLFSHALGDLLLKDNCYA